MDTTVKVTNISTRATERDLWEFFTFSGEIQNIEVHDAEGGESKIAHVTFVEDKALETALLLTGAVIIDRPVTVETAVGYKPPEGTKPVVLPTLQGGQDPSAGAHTTAAPAGNAHEVVAALLAKGYILSKDAMAMSAEAVATSRTAINNSQIANKMSTTAANLDQKIGFREKLTAGALTVNQSLKSVDEKYGVRDRTKSALVTAEQKVNEAGAALMQNKYVQSGSAWLTSAFSQVSSRVTKVTDDISAKTKEKISQHEGGSGSAAVTHDLPPPQVSVGTAPLSSHIEEYTPTSYGGLSDTATPAVVPHVP